MVKDFRGVRCQRARGIRARKEIQTDSYVSYIYIYIYMYIYTYMNINIHIRMYIFIYRLMYLVIQSLSPIIVQGIKMTLQVLPSLKHGKSGYRLFLLKMMRRYLRKNIQRVT
jgi:hypothetical protein